MRHTGWLGLAVMLGLAASVSGASLRAKSPLLRRLQADENGMCTGCFTGTQGACITSSSVCFPDQGGVCPMGSLPCSDDVMSAEESLGQPTTGGGTTGGSTLDELPVPSRSPKTPLPVFGGECPPLEHVVVGYYGSWAAYRREPYNMMPEDIDSRLLTHTIYSFATMDASYKIVPFDRRDVDTENPENGMFYRFVNHTKTLNPCSKPMYALGGWNFGSAAFSRMAASESARATFIQSNIDFCRQHGFEGVDIDWEYPTRRGGSAADRANLVTLVREFHEAIVADHEANPDLPIIDLSLAVFADPRHTPTMYDQAELHKYVDWIGLMTYDLAGSWDARVGAHTAMQGMELSLRNGMNRWMENGTPANKLVLGIASYGRTWSVGALAADATEPTAPGSGGFGGGQPGPYTGEGGFLAFYEIQQLIDTQGGVKAYDEATETHYAQIGTTWVGYDEPEDIQTKVDYVLEEGFLGTMLWSLESDDFLRDNPLGRVAAQLAPQEIPEFTPAPSREPSVSATPSPGSEPSPTSSPIPESTTEAPTTDDGTTTTTTTGTTGGDSSSAAVSGDGSESTESIAANEKDMVDVPLVNQKVEKNYVIIGGVVLGAAVLSMGLLVRRSRNNKKKQQQGDGGDVEAAVSGKRKKSMFTKSVQILPSPVSNSSSRKPHSPVPSPVSIAISSPRSTGSQQSSPVMSSPVAMASPSRSSSRGSSGHATPLRSSPLVPAMARSISTSSSHSSSSSSGTRLPSPSRQAASRVSRIIEADATGVTSDDRDSDGSTSPNFSLTAKLQQRVPSRSALALTPLPPDSAAAPSVKTSNSSNNLGSLASMALQSLGSRSPRGSPSPSSGALPMAAPSTASSRASSHHSAVSAASSHHSAASAASSHHSTVSAASSHHSAVSAASSHHSAVSAASSHHSAAAPSTASSRASSHHSAAGSSSGTSQA